jgi:hypothetical protein
MKTKYFVLASAVAIVTSLMLLKNCDNKNNTISKNKVPEAYIDAPFDEQVPRTIFDVDASEGAILKYGQTEINIPESAFLDKDGKVVKGKVKLAYREVNDPVTIMMSGVPMETAEGSQEYLESAGMLEMIAWKGKEPLFVNPDRKIKVNMESDFSDDNYNLYNLDTVNRQWVEVESDVPAEELKRELPSVEEISTYKEPNFAELASKKGLIKPVKPELKDKELFQFKFKTDFSQYPELNIYNGVQWEFAGKKDSENPAKNKWVTTAVWNEMEIVKRKKNGIYKLKLVKGDKVFETTVRPVFDSRDMEYAEYVFNQTYDKYKTFIETKKEEEKEKARQRKIRQEQAAQRNKVYELTGKFSREFEIQSFGWANLDRIYKIEPQSILASFVDAKGSSLPVRKVYLLMDSVNSMLTYTPYNLDKFKFDPKSKNSLIVVDSLAQAYAIGNSEFERITGFAKKHEFKVGTPLKVKSETDIRKLINNI